MRINYQLMGEANKNEHGRYIPDYDALIDGATCEDERKEWEATKAFAEKYELEFPFELVTCLQQRCGHWEVFQHPIGCVYSVKEALDNLVESSKSRRCTRCICNWNVKEVKE